MRAIDWAATSLGPAEQWPQSLKTAVRITLTSRQPMFVWWGEDLINLYNDAYISVLGGKHPDALAQPASEVWKEIWDQVSPRASWVMHQNEGTYDEALLLIMERNGYPEETYYTFSYSPVPNDQGGPGGIICANTEDTLRIIGERQLALLRELATGTADARTLEEACILSARCLGTDLRDFPFAMIYLVDSETGRATLTGTSGIEPGHIAAPAMADMEEISIWPVMEAIRTQQVQVVDDLKSLAGTLPTGAWGTEPHQVVVVPITSKGHRERTGVLIAALNPFRLFDDNYSRFIDLVASQVAASSANAQAYEEERGRAETLAELDRAKTAFFSNVSHEFRTPLTLMLGPLNDVLTQPAEELGEGNRGLLSIVHRNGQRLLKLVNTLLDFSRIEAGRMQASYEPVDLAALTAEFTSVFRAAVEKAGMKLVVDCPTLPEPVFVDRDMWEKIILNLVSNAFKYTLDGEIRVALHAGNGEAILTVEDTGTGIPESELPNIFNRFHRVEGARARTHEGTGIGLAIVQEFVRLHGGTVVVESVHGRGSTFTITIPLGSEHLPADRIGGPRTLVSTALGAAPFIEEAQRWMPAELTSSDPDDSSPPYSSNLTAPQTLNGGTRATILLADDNADMRDYVHRLLLPNYNVIAVGDGMEALQAVAAHTPQLVLTDVMMPNLDGFGLLKAMRDDPRTAAIPIIMLSARAGEEARVEGLESGADDYLTKPFSSRELLARIAGTLALANARHEAMRREAELKAENIITLESINEGFVALGHDLRFTYVNREAERIFGMSRENVIGELLWDAFPPLRGTRADAEFNRAMTERTVVRFEFFYEPWSRWFEINGHPSPDGGIAIYFRDISEHKRIQAVVAGQKQALELAVHGAELRSVLEVFTRTVETQSSDGVIASILLLDEDGVHLRHGASPGLPESYSSAIDGLTIGPAVGSCGTAAYTGQVVEVADIGTDPLWNDYRDLALEHGLRSCWSTPILSLQGKVLGTFAIYHREVRMPAARDREVVNLLTHTAAIIIERELAIREREATKDNLALQVETLTRLHNLSRLLADTMELSPALRAILETVVDIHGADYGLISLYDPASGFLHSNASIGFDSAALNVLGKVLPGPDAGACGTAFITRERAVVTDTETDPRFEKYREAARTTGFRAVHSTPILTRSGDILGVLSVYFRESRQPSQREMQLADMCALHAADAIEAARSQQALRESEQRFRSMADHAPMMVWVTEQSGSCSFLSTSWYEFTGQTPEAGLGFGWLDAVHPEDRQSTRDAFIAASNGRQPFRHEYRLHHHDGTYRWAIDAAAPRFDAEGVFMGCIGSVIDITDRKIMEDALEESGRRKDEFLATLAHELRNPLAPLRSGLELLRLLGDSDPQTTEEVRSMMERQLGQMVRLIDDLLDVSRISRNKLELRREQVDLQDVVRSAVETSRPVIEQAGHELTIDMPAGATLVHGDVTRLAQVFSNLLNNAAKYTRPSGHIALSVERLQDDVLVKITDDGVGIPRHMLEEIFEMFTQVDRSLEKSHGGLGIGLTLVKRLVELHGGTVEARSAGPNMGSEFVVCLPRVLSTPDEQPADAGGDDMGRTSGYRILVVDDNHDSALSLTMMLDFMNNVTRIAYNGLDALKIAAEFRPDIVLLDIGMPGMNGYDVARSIREQAWGSQAILIALTGWGQEEDRRRSREAGFDHHLLKPVEPGMLRTLLAGLKTTGTSINTQSGNN